MCSTVMRIDEMVWLIVYIVPALCNLGMDCYEDKARPWANTRQQQVLKEVG